MRRHLSFSEHWFQIMSKPDDCGGYRISKKKIALTMIGVVAIVAILIWGVSAIAPSSLPEMVQPAMLMLQGLSSSPIVFSVLIILVFLAFCGSGFTVAKIGEVECAFFDKDGNTVMDEVKALHKKVDSINSQIYTGKIESKIVLSGIQEDYKIEEVVKKNGN